MHDDDEMFEVQQLKAMQQPSWSEGRLDDLNRKVDAGIGRLDEERKELRGEMRAGFEGVGEEFKSVRAEFKAVQAEFKAVRAEMKAGFEKVDDEFKAVRGEMRAGFERIDERFDRLTRFQLWAAVAVVVALIGAPQL